MMENLTALDDDEQIYASLNPHLHKNVRLLGGLLGKAIRRQSGDALYQQVEAIRQVGDSGAQ